MAADSSVFHHLNVWLGPFLISQTVSYSYCRLLHCTPQLVETLWQESKQGWPAGEACPLQLAGLLKQLQAVLCFTWRENEVSARSRGTGLQVTLQTLQFCFCSLPSARGPEEQLVIPQCSVLLSHRYSCDVKICFQCLTDGTWALKGQLWWICFTETFLRISPVLFIYIFHIKHSSHLKIIHFTKILPHGQK